jgi:hypothetical protein
MSPEKLDAVLRELEAAERSGNPAKVLRLVLELLKHLARAPGGSSISLASRLGVDLLERAGVEFHRLGYHAEAEQLLGVAVEKADAQRYAYERVLCRLRRATCLTALVRLGEADRLLGEVLDGSASEVKSRLEVAARLVAGSGGGARPAEIQALACHALGRLWAAQGLLGEADEAFARSMAVAGGPPIEVLDPEEVAIAQAEARIDRGDFKGFEIVHRENQAAGSALVRDKWAILVATVRLMQGDLSEADRELTRLTREAAVDGALLPYFGAALWQWAQTLTFLNRLNEADAVLHWLGRLGSFDAGDIDRMKRLIRARRGYSGSELNIPPAPADGLARGAHAPRPRGRPHNAGAGGSPFDRSRERLRDEWSWHANLIELDLHEGRVDDATFRFAQLRAIGRRVDSRLIRAQSEYLHALVAYYSGPREREAALVHAEAACRTFEELGLIPSAWQARVLLDWTLRRSGAPPDALRENLTRERDLLDRVERRLSPADRIYYTLNKWTSVDKTVSAWLRDLAARRRSAAPRRSAAWSDRARLRREAREVLGRILLVKRWADLPEQAPAGPDAAAAARPPVVPGPDVYTWVATQLALRPRAEPPASRLLVPRWLPRDTAVLVYVVLPDRLELFLVTRRRGCELVRLPRETARVELRELVNRVTYRSQASSAWGAGHLSRPDEPAAPDLDETVRHLGEYSHDTFPGPDDPEAAHRAGEVLARRLGITGVNRLLPKRVTRLAIIPDDILVNVPFAALPLDGQPLVARFAPYLLPAWRWSPGPRRQDRDLHEGLGVAVPESDAEPDAPRLAQAVEEINRIDLVIHRGSGHRLTPHKSTCEETTAGLETADFAHFACHGIFNPLDPFRSGLLLKDRWLTIDELARVRSLRLDRVVLASCWSAITTVLPGREMISLPGAFLRIGARCVVSSLWRVEDPASPVFMKRLYSWFARCPAVEALAGAQRVFWRAHRPTRQWAAYTVWSDGLAPASFVVRWALRWIDYQHEKRASRMPTNGPQSR